MKKGKKETTVEPPPVDESDTNASEEESDPFLCISLAQLEEFRTIDTIESTINQRHNRQLDLLCTFFSVSHYHSNPRSRFYIDYLLNALAFAAESNFSSVVTLYFVSIMNSIYRHEDASQTKEEVFQDFSTLIRQYSCSSSSCNKEDEDASNNIIIFENLSDVKKMVTYASTTFFRQFDLYSYMKRNPPLLRHELIPLVVELPVTPAPLSVAKQHNDHLCDTSTTTTRSPETTC